VLARYPWLGNVIELRSVLGLGGHFKTGHRGSLQNRPTNHHPGRTLVLPHRLALWQVQFDPVRSLSSGAGCKISDGILQDLISVFSPSGAAVNTQTPVIRFGVPRTTDPFSPPAARPVNPQFLISHPLQPRGVEMRKHGVARGSRSARDPQTDVLLLPYCPFFRGCDHKFSVAVAAASLVRQLRGPHLSTCP
jgi:hypothetical protein